MSPMSPMSQNTAPVTDYRPLNGKMRQRFSPEVKASALILWRSSFGGQRRIAKKLSLRFRIDLNEWTVHEWIQGVPRDIDPLDFITALVRPTTPTI